MLREGYRDRRIVSCLPRLFRLTYYAKRNTISLMIKTFRSKETEALFQDHDVRRFRSIERAARRKLLYLHRARSLVDLRVPPGNHLEMLKGDRKGQQSIRVNDQWRICFVWHNGEAFDVEIVDYH